jgi:hypothetical protein
MAACTGALASGFHSFLVMFSCFLLNYNDYPTTDFSICSISASEESGDAAEDFFVKVSYVFIVLVIHLLQCY